MSKNDKNLKPSRKLVGIINNFNWIIDHTYVYTNRHTNAIVQNI